MSGAGNWNPFATGYANNYGPSEMGSQLSVGRSSGQSSLAMPNNFNALSQAEQREVMFGAPLRAPITTAEDVYAVESRIRPFAWAYEGHNARINSTLIKRITENDDFPIRVLLPIQVLPDGGKVRITQMQFNEHQLDDVPEMGVVRMVTSSFREWTHQLKRKGLGFTMDDGYAMTEQGILSYAASLVQISNATIDTLTLDAYYNLLTTNGAAESWTELFGITHNNVSHDDLFAYETGMWSVLSKTDFGFWHMLDSAREVMAARRTSGDSLVLPYNMRNYLKRNRAETREFYRVGPEGPANFFSLRGFIHRAEDVDVYESQLYKLGENDMPEDPLVRPRQIGEFFLMAHRINCQDINEGYQSKFRNITIHDNKTDRFREIRFSDVIKYSGLFDRNTAEREPSEDVGRAYFAGNNSVGEFLAGEGALQIVSRAILQKAGAPGAVKTSFDALFSAPVPADRSAELLTQAGVRGRVTSGSHDGYGMPNDDDDDDEDGASAFLSTGGSTEAAPVENVLYRPQAADIVDLRAADPKTLSPAYQAEEKNSGSNVYYLFKTYVESKDANGGQPKWTRQLITQLKAELDKEFVKKRRETVRLIPWVQTLRVMFANTDEQVRAYDLFGADVRVPTEFLEMLFEGAARKEVITRGGFSHIRFNHSAAGYTEIKSAVVDPAELEGYCAALRNKYPEINAKIPDFLPGAVHFLLRAEKATYSDVKISIDNVFIPLAKRIVEMEAEAFDPTASRVRSNLAKVKGSSKLDKVDEVPAVRLLIRLLQHVNSSEQVKAIENWYTDAAGAKNGVALNDEATAKTAVGKLTTDLTGAKPHEAKIDATDVAQSIIASLYKIPITAKFFEWCVENNVPCALDFALVRPHMNYEMGSAIFMKKGSETGASYFGEADFQLANDGNRKVLTGNFTARLGSRVTKPQNVHILHNISCKRYLNGGGVTMFDPLDPNERAAYQDGNTNNKDIFVIPLHWSESIDETRFDITGYYPDELEGAYATDTLRAQYRMNMVMAELWGWQHRDSYFDIEYFGASGAQKSYNTIVFQAHQFMPSLTNNSVNDRGLSIPGKGHWGPNVYEGVAADRVGRGNNKCVVNVDWTKLSMQR